MGVRFGIMSVNMQDVKFLKTVGGCALYDHTRDRIKYIKYITK